ncbi:helix-turn-helix transcriptional regulator [Staphylococcus ureilyticus]|uniref:helix-turn-helix domain-containing protein n=1 Tax=Staphylococcus ureilyticus TaxID=94138 RepID=UPI0029278B7F|nr:helix-turn-helix transcriptional regulator [Staphylococcus ureilyticus]MDU9371579.1 helix-turn-helix transcriptional regulator [Staphylococcus ureilyticus]
MNTFQKIRNLANKEGLSIAELERKLNLSNGSISRWKNAAPSSKGLIAVADHFDVSVDYLLGREKESRKGEELDEDIRIMQRAAQNMSEEDRKKAIKVFEAFFDNWEDITKDEKQ